MFRRTSAAFAAMAMLASPLVAAAASGSDDVLVNADTGLEMRRITISFKDLDLATMEGRRVANKRVENAALVACAWATGTVLPETEEYRSCYAGVIQEGRSQMIRTAEIQRKDSIAS